LSLDNSIFVIIIVTDFIKIIMNINSQFVVATHIMAILAGNKLYREEHACTNSEMISKSVNTNPVVIRRILSKLAEANLVVSKPGPHGGSEIARHPSKITLEEIYLAVDEKDSLFHMHYGDPNADCPIGGHIQDSLKVTIDRAKDSIKKVLVERTLFDLTNDILARAGLPVSQSAENISKALRVKIDQYQTATTHNKD
jgi:Rrf2 family protein